MKPAFMIAIFDIDLKATAFLLVLPDQEISLEFLGSMNEENKTALSALVESFKVTPPRMKSEILNGSEITVGLQPIKPDSGDYLSAVAEELNIAGFAAKILPVVIKSLVIYYSIKLDRKQREVVLADLVNVPSDIDEEAVEQLKSILLDMEELKA